MASRPVFVSFTDLSLTFPEIRLANVTTTSTKLGQDDAGGHLGCFKEMGCFKKRKKGYCLMRYITGIHWIYEAFMTLVILFLHDSDVHQKTWGLI